MCGSTYVTNLMSGPVTDAELAICVGIIEKGEAVNVALAGSELPKATAVAVTRLNGAIVGVGVIKRERLDYAEKISERAGFVFPAETLELGYVAVDQAHRGNGLSHALVAALIANRNDALFATTSSKQMKKVLCKAGFARGGDEWDGNNSRLSLWLHPARQST